MRPKSFGTFEKRVPAGPGSCLFKILCRGKLSWVVETCWKDVESMLKEFKSVLFAKMFGMLTRGWSHLPRSFNIVEKAHAQLRRRNHGHHGCKGGSKARQFCVWLIVRANLSLGEITLFPPRTCLRVISCSMKLSIRWKTARLTCITSLYSAVSSIASSFTMLLK